MNAAIEPTTSLPPTMAGVEPTSLRALHVCAHCHQRGTTACGALWRTSARAECSDLYYLHSGCLRRYKAAHILLSVEGRIPRVPLDDRAGAHPYRHMTVAAGGSHE